MPQPSAALYTALLRLWRVLPSPQRVRSLFLWCTTTHYLIAVCGLIWDAEGRLLLARHSYRPSPGWNLPGGSLHKLEDPVAGLRRELAEELGCTVDIESLVGWVMAQSPRRAVFAFNCRWRAGTFRPNPEITEIGYFPLEQALQLLPRESRALVQRAARLRPQGRSWSG